MCQHYGYGIITVDRSTEPPWERQSTRMPLSTRVTSRILILLVASEKNLPYALFSPTKEE